MSSLQRGTKRKHGAIEPRGSSAATKKAKRSHTDICNEAAAFLQDLKTTKHLCANFRTISEEEEKNKIQSCVKDLGQCIGDFKVKCRAFTLLGHAMKCMGDYREANRYYVTALNITSTHEILWGIASTHSALKEYEESVRACNVLKEASELTNWEKSYVYEFSASNGLSMGNRENAIKDMRRAVELVNTYPISKLLPVSLTWVKCAQTKLAQILVDFARTLPTSENQRRKQLYSEAVQAFQSALQHTQDVTEQARIYAAIGCLYQRIDVSDKTTREQSNMNYTACIMHVKTLYMLKDKPDIHDPAAIQKHIEWDRLILDSKYELLANLHYIKKKQHRQDAIRACIDSYIDSIQRCVVKWKLLGRIGVKVAMFFQAYYALKVAKIIVLENKQLQDAIQICETYVEMWNEDNELPYCELEINIYNVLTRTRSVNFLQCGFSFLRALEIKAQILKMQPEGCKEAVECYKKILSFEKKLRQSDAEDRHKLAKKLGVSFDDDQHDKHKQLWEGLLKSCKKNLSTLQCRAREQSTAPAASATHGTNSEH